MLHRDIPVLLDGAHTLCMMPTDIESYGADFFVCNCHKWMCSSRGAAILYVKANMKKFIKPFIVSHGSGHGFTSEFIWDGRLISAIACS